MMYRWIGKSAIPLVVLLALSACQPVGYQRDYARTAYTAASACGTYRYARPSDCYQRPVRYAPKPTCATASYGHDCGPVYRQRAFRYVDRRYVSEGPVRGCCSGYTGRYRPLRPDYLPNYQTYRSQRYRPARDYYRAPCC